LSSHQKYVDAILNAALVIAKKALIERAVLAIPFLATGLPNRLLLMLVDRIASIVLKETEIRIFFAYTDFRVNRQATEFVRAVVINQEAKTPEDKAHAEAMLISSFRDLIKLR
jgi:hypothetical protein